MTPIDEAALKAGISDEEIEAIAMQCCGELHGDELHMKRHQRIAFARALLHRSQGQEPVARNNALRDDHPLSKGFCAHDVSMAKHCAACAKPPSRDTVVPAEQAEDSAMLDWLEPQQGVNLVSDDGGKWAISDSGVQECPPEGGFTTPTAITSFVDPEDWKPTIRAAIRAAMSNREAGGS